MKINRQQLMRDKDRTPGMCTSTAVNRARREQAQSNAAGVLATDLGKTYVQCNSLKYWAIVMSVIPFIGIITWAVRAHLVK